MFSHEKRRNRRPLNRHVKRHRVGLRALERLESRQLLTLTIVANNLTDFVPFSGIVATLSSTDITGLAAGTDSAEIYWGDGTSTTGTIYDNNGVYDVVTAPHTYTNSGEMQVAVALANPIDGSSLYVPGTIKVLSGLSVTANPITATEGEAFSGVVGSFVDENSNSQPADFNVKINWGDGQSLVGVVPTLVSGGNGAPNLYSIVVPSLDAHTYTSQPTDPLSITVARASNSDQATGSSAVDVIAPVLNVYPTSFTAIPGKPFTGTVATFTDSNINESAVNFQATIDWGDSSPVTTNITPVPIAGSPGQFSIIATHTYATAKTYATKVTLTQTVLNISVPQESGIATVASPTPTVTVTGTPAGTPVVSGVPFTGIIGTFTDNADTNVSDYSATLSTPKVLTSQPTPSLFSGAPILATSTSPAYPQTIFSEGNGVFEVYGTVTFATVGTYGETLTITDAPQGGTSTSFSGNTTITVSPSALVLTGATSAGGGPLSATVGTAFYGTVATFTDSNPNATASNYTATINWGSGTGQTSSPATIVQALSSSGQAVPGDFTVQGDNIYTTAGTYLATVTVTRSLDGKSFSVTTPVTVSPTNFVASAVKPIIATAGQPFGPIPVATFTDTSGDPIGDYSASILWATGATTSGTISGSNGHFSVEGNYTYATPGAEVATVTITRLTDKVTATAATSITVNGQLSVMPTQSLSATIAQEFSGELAKIVDAQTGLASDFTASIKWGDGTSSAATVVAVPATTTNQTTTTSSTTGIPSTTIASSTTGSSSAATSYLAVVGSHAYAQGGFDTIQVKITRISSGQFTVVNIPIAVYGITAALTPTGVPTVVDGVVALATNQQEPTISGMAQPGATIQLTYRPLSGGTSANLGEIQANANGDWSLIVGPIGAKPIEVFAVVTPPNGTPTTPIPLFGGFPLVVLQKPRQPVHTVVRKASLRVDNHERS